jgi:hypothetical protein
MPLKAYEQFAAEPLAFPIRGKIYTPPEIGMRTGTTLARLLAGDRDAASTNTTSLWQLVLGCTRECQPHEERCPADCAEHAGACGSVYDQMREDDVPLEAVARAGFAVLVDWQNDRDAAIRVWESGIDPEARAALAAAARSTIQPSTPSAAASTTRKRASGTGTRKTPKKKTKKGRAPGPGSRSSAVGPTSSPTSPPSTEFDSTEKSPPGESSPT